MVGWLQAITEVTTDRLVRVIRFLSVRGSEVPGLIDLTVLLDRVQSTEKLPGTRFTRVQGLLSAPTRALSSGR